MQDTAQLDHFAQEQVDQHLVTTIASLSTFQSDDLQRIDRYWDRGQYVASVSQSYIEARRVFEGSLDVLAHMVVQNPRLIKPSFSFIHKLNAHPDFVPPMTKLITEACDIQSRRLDGFLRIDPKYAADYYWQLARFGTMALASEEAAKLFGMRCGMIQSGTIDDERIANYLNIIFPRKDATIIFVDYLKGFVFERPAA